MQRLGRFVFVPDMVTVSDPSPGYKLVEIDGGLCILPGPLISLTIAAINKYLPWSVSRTWMREVRVQVGMHCPAGSIATGKVRTVAESEQCHGSWHAIIAVVACSPLCQLHGRARFDKY